METSGIKLGRGLGSRRRLPHERPHFTVAGEQYVRVHEETQLEERVERHAPVRSAAAALRRSKSLHAKAGGEASPEGDREFALLSWNLNKARRKDKADGPKKTVEEDVNRVPLRKSRHQTTFESPALSNSQNEVPNPDFITRLVSVIGDISCPVHPERSIQSCPRECGWHIEHHIERGKLDTDLVEKRFGRTQLDKDQVDEFPSPGSDSTTLVSSIAPTSSRTSTVNETKVLRKQYSFGVRPCYLLIFLGLTTIVGSLAPALWRANVDDDFSGGFTLAQYILGVGIFIVGSMVAIHSRTCTCWHSSPSEHE